MAGATTAQGVCCTLTRGGALSTQDGAFTESYISTIGVDFVRAQRRSVVTGEVVSDVHLGQKAGDSSAVGVCGAV